MLTSLSLRLRIFLFFCLLAAGSAALAAGALAFGWSRGDAGLPTGPFLTAFIAFTFLNTGLALGVWLLFDENVAKPITRLSADLRLRAHSGVACDVDTEAARYLGDLAPAASALTETMSSSVMDTAAQVARETQRLKSESERLTALLTEIPIATILLNPAQEIVLYDAQAAAVLAQIAPPRLKAPLSDYFDMGAVAEAMEAFEPAPGPVSVRLQDATASLHFDARLKALGKDGHMLMIDVDTAQSAPIGQRPLVFDFDLITAAETKEIRETALCDLCYVPFDSETTGLSIETDDIVQLGAVRVLNGRIVEGEVLNTYVNPGRPIPSASTAIHRVTDADVADAPDIATAGRRFHHFARDAVLVAHNAPFDIGLLRRVQGEMGVEWDHPVLDTVLLSAVVFGTTEDHSLDALCDRLAVSLPEALRHTALGDAQATAEALVRLLPLLEAKGIRTFGDLVDATRQHGRLLEDLNS
ncbi:3'-5' exonuclease [Roseobacter sinensis]|uniref:DNA-directed DNA polymerase n=1 Tax=Roseobacter sinensis TaxID=2931391 RepID=A0ABT3BEA2_9RHOB|nr:3'-5' exonuclease [Roseobacter sp. WL0113]MCV3271888.1 3'-5' exonuclease [Roseobacter sp. WL0113]